MFGTHVQEKGAIGIFFSHAMVSDDTLPRIVVPSYSSIEVAKHNQLVAAWDSADRCLQTFVETFFLIIWVCHCWCICNNYGGVILSGQSDAHRHKSFTLIMPLGGVSMWHKYDVRIANPTPACRWSLAGLPIQKKV